jgi:RsiW-degrading membrane proteinase PrsW (M82 family)
MKNINYLLEKYKLIFNCANFMDKKIPAGLGLRVAISIIVVFGWLIYAIVHVVFFWENFSTTQNIALIIITFLVGVAILGAMWAAWGIGIGKQFSEKNDKEKSK